MSQLAPGQLKRRADEATESLPRDGEATSFVELLLILSHWKKEIFTVTLAFGVLSLLVSLLIPNKYTATTSILPPQGNQSLGAALLSQVAGGAGAAGAAGAGALAAFAGKELGLKNSSESYVAMLQSRKVEDAIIQKFDLQNVYGKKYISDARKKLESNSEVKLLKEGLIRVSVEDSDPARSAAIANNYIEQLQKLTSQLALSEAGQRRMFLQRQIDQEKNDLANAEVALKQTQQKTGIMQLDSQAKVIIEAVGQLRAQIAETEVELHALELSATKENPEYLRLKERLSGLRTQLAKLETQENGTGDMQVPTGKLPELGLEYMRHYRDFKYHETVFEFLAKQLEVARIDEAREGAIIQVVDNAVTPDKKSWPKKGLITLLGTLFGLVFSILGVFAMHTWARQTGSSQTARIEELKRLWAR